MAAEIKTRERVVAARPNVIPIKGWVFMAPLVYEWAQSDKTMGFPPKKHTETDSYQATVNWMQVYLYEGLKARGFLPSGTAFLLTNGWKLDDYGRTPPMTQLSNNARRLEAQYMYVADGQKEWQPRDFYRMNAIHKGWGGAIFVSAHATWYYGGHTKLNGEAMPVYEVGEHYEVTVCDNANNCRSQQFALGKPLMSMRPLPSFKTEDPAILDWIMKFNAKTTADTVLGMVEAMAKPMPIPM